jgi:transposase
MQFTHILGIDVSKRTIDIALSINQANTPTLSHQFTNNLGGYKKWSFGLRNRK